MRIVLVLAGLVLLTGCNGVVTKDPLFASADETGGAPLRPGVWALFSKPDCKLDSALPLDQWPDCAGAGVVHSGEIVGYDRKDGKGVWEATPFIFAAGEPRIAQLKSEDEVTSGDNHQKTTTYIYAGVRPTKTDAEGRITAVTYWQVLCGPPPPKDKDGADTAMGTLHPLPGMEMKPGDPTCTTTSKAALRGAAKASEAWADNLSTASWVRDGDR